MPVESRAHAHVDTPIQPFWERLRSFIVYPWRGGALAVLLAVSLGQVLTLLPVVGWIIGLALLAVGYKYAFTIARETAHGRLDPPVDVLEVPDSVVVKFLGLYVALFVAIIVLAIALGPVAALLGAIVFMLALPAATMSLAMDESLSAALNPATWWAIVSRLGGAYAILVVLLLVFQLSAANAGGLAERWLPPGVAGIVVTAISFWGVFGTFHLMGYLLYQYHERFGFEPQAHVFAAARPQSRDELLLRESEALLREGRIDEARAQLRDAIDTRAVPLEAHERYRKLLCQDGDAARASQHGAMYLNILVLEGDYRRALGLARECLSADPTFAPLLGEQGLALAQRARGMGQSQLAIDLLASLRRRFPRDRERPVWALMEADLLLQRPGGEPQAHEALQGAREHCDDEAQLRQIDALLATTAA